MNERIKELVEQAGMRSPDLFKLTVSHMSIDTLEKFAELIVQDIIGIVEGYCETSPEIMGLPLDILEHFDMEIDDDELA